MLSKSLVMGIHNGLKYLPYSLANIKMLAVDEIIFVLDHCKPVGRFVESITRAMNGTNLSYTICVKNFAYTRFRPNETFRYGFNHTDADVVYVSAEDIVLDPTIFSLMHWVDDEVGMVDFRWYNYDPFNFNYHVFLDNILLKISDVVFGYGTNRSGIFGVRKKAYDQVGGFKDVPSEEDWLRRDIVDAGFKHKHVKTCRCLHLRPSYDKERQIMQGVSRKQYGYSYFRMLVHCWLHAKPYVARGYINGKNQLCLEHHTSSP